jgi:transposase
MLPVPGPGRSAELGPDASRHVHAFQTWNGQPRAILYDNLKAAVLERRGSQILFNPRLLELSAHYHFAPQPCQVRAGNQK